MECDRLFSDDYPSFKGTLPPADQTMPDEIIYQLHLEAAGVPEDLATVWGVGVARRDSEFLGLYRYFVGGVNHG